MSFFYHPICHPPYLRTLKSLEHSTLTQDIQRFLLLQENLKTSSEYSVIPNRSKGCPGKVSQSTQNSSLTSLTITYQKVKVKVSQSCLTLCDAMDCSPPGSSVYGILQARILEWVVISFSRGSSQPRDRTQVSCIAGRSHQGSLQNFLETHVILANKVSWSILASFPGFQHYCHNNRASPVAQW